MKKKLLIAGIFAASLTAVSVIPVKADVTQAWLQAPQLSIAYHVDDAEQDLRGKSNKLQSLKDAHAPQDQIDRTQAEVNAAANLLNSLKSMVAYQTLVTAAAPAPDVSAAVINQAAANAAAANQDAVTKQLQANQAAFNAMIVNQQALLNQAAINQAAAANQAAVNAQASANQAMLNAAVANQSAFATVATYNPLMFAVATAKPVNDPYAHNLVLLDNINKISAAQTEARGAREIANGTLSRINDMKRDLVYLRGTGNPVLMAQADDLERQMVALQSAYDAQNADAASKEANAANLKATLPTAGYNPALTKYYYAN